MRTLSLIISGIIALVALVTYFDTLGKGNKASFWVSWRIILAIAAILLAIAGFFLIPKAPTPKPRLAIDTAPFFSNVNELAFNVNWSISNVGNAIADSLNALQLEIDYKDGIGRIHESNISSSIPYIVNLIPGGTVPMSRTFITRNLDSTVVFFIRIA